MMQLNVVSKPVIFDRLPAKSIAWPDLVLSPNWLKKLDRIALRRFGQVGLAEEAATYVIQELSAEEWQLLSNFRGQASLDTYLQAVTNNLLEEFARRRFGRPRPPEWLKRQGPTWIRIWKMLSLERQSPSEVLVRFQQEGMWEAGFVEQAIRVIRARIPSCGQPIMETTSTEFGQEPTLCDVDEWDIPLQPGPDYVDQQRLIDKLMLTLSLCIFPSRPSAAPDDVPVRSDETTEVQQCPGVPLNGEERLVLKLLYQDGLKKKIIADALGYKRHQLSRVLQRALGKLQQGLHDHQLDPDIARAIWDEAI